MRSYKRRSNPRRRRVYRRRAGARRNPALKARAAHNPRQRSYRRRSYRYRSNPRPRVNRRRRNPPEIAGLKLVEILYCGGAVVVVPFVENQVRPLLPTSMQSGATGRWVVKVGSSAAVWQAWRYIFGKRIGDLTGLVLGANLLSDAAGEFMPSLTAGLSGYRALPSRQLGGFLQAPLTRRGNGLSAGRQLAGNRGMVRGPLDPTY